MKEELFNEGKSNKELKILIADDNEFFRKGLIESFKDEYIEINGVNKLMTFIGEASNGEEAIRKCEHLKPDLIIMDIVMSCKTGIEALELIRENDKSVKIIMVSGYPSDENLIASIKNLCNGFLDKHDIHRDRMKMFIQQAFLGIFPIDEGLLQNIIHIIPSSTVTPSLPSIESYGFSKTQLEIFKLVAKGFSNEEIASKLNLSPKTVSNNICGNASYPGLLEKTKSPDRFKLQKLGTDYGFNIEKKINSITNP